MHILVTKILNDVVKEIDGSEPIYKNEYWYPSTLEYEVSFKIPSKDQGEYMIDDSNYFEWIIA